MGRSLVDYLGLLAGRHTLLRGGWSAAQLAVMAEAIAGKTGKRCSPAKALLACSVLAEWTTTGGGLRCSRRLQWYTHFAAASGEEHISYRKTVPAMDELAAEGLAVVRLGDHRLGKQTVVTATAKLQALAHLIDVSARQAATPKDLIELRDHDRRRIGFTDTAEIHRMRREVAVCNEALARQLYRRRNGTAITVPPMVRVFNETFARGGRLYCQGSSYQQMPKAQRDQISMVMPDGSVVPTVEVDYASLHPRLLYFEAGEELPAGDLYEIEWFDRRLAKLGLLILINAANRDEAIGAIAAKLRDDDDLRAASGLHGADHQMLVSTARRLIERVETKHHPIRAHFGTGRGAQLMRTDSDMAMSVMLGMITRTGRCPLPLGDSFIVAESDAGVLREVMDAALQRAAHPVGPGAVAVARPPVQPHSPAKQTSHRLPDLGRSDRPSLSGNPPSIHMGLHPSEQGFPVGSQSPVLGPSANTAEIDVEASRPSTTPPPPHLAPPGPPPGHQMTIPADGDTPPAGTGFEALRNRLAEAHRRSRRRAQESPPAAGGAPPGPPPFTAARSIPPWHPPTSEDDN